MSLGTAPAGWWDLVEYSHSAVSSTADENDISVVYHVKSWGQVIIQCISSGMIYSISLSLQSEWSIIHQLIYNTIILEQQACFQDNLCFQISHEIYVCAQFCWALCCGVYNVSPHLIRLLIPQGCSIFNCFSVREWTHRGLVIPYGDISLGQHWLR